MNDDLLVFECMNNSFGEYNTEKGMMQSRHNFQNSINDKSSYFLNYQTNINFPNTSASSLLCLSVENNSLVGSSLNPSNSQLESPIKSQTISNLSENNFIKNAYMVSDSFFVSLCDQNIFRTSPVKQQANDMMDEMDQMFN
jgi:hypothetical protein